MEFDSKLLNNQTLRPNEVFSSAISQKPFDNQFGISIKDTIGVSPIRPILGENFNTPRFDPENAQNQNSHRNFNLEEKSLKSGRGSKLPVLGLPIMPNVSKIDMGALSLIESAKLRRERQHIERDWNKIFTESNLRLIQVLKSRKKKKIHHNLGWKKAKEIDENDRLRSPVPLKMKKERLQSKSVSNLKSVGHEIKPESSVNSSTLRTGGRIQLKRGKSMKNFRKQIYDLEEKKKCKEILRMLEIKSLENKHYFNTLKMKEEKKKYNMLPSTEINFPQGKTFSERYSEFNGNIDPIAARFKKKRENSKNYKSALGLNLAPLKIPRLIGAGRRREFGSVTKLENSNDQEEKRKSKNAGFEEAELMKVMDSAEDKPSFIQGVIKTLQYKPADSIGLDWKTRGKLLDYSSIRTEVLSLDQWKRQHLSGQIYLN